MQEIRIESIPLTALKHVGIVLAKKLSNIQLITIQDLLLHLPLRYEDRTKIFAIKNLKEGLTATVIGEIQRTTSSSHKRILQCQISDGTGQLTLLFFNFNAITKKILAVGKKIAVYGIIHQGRYGLEIIHPEYQIQKKTHPLDLQKNLTPVYATTAGVKQTLLRKLINEAIELITTIPVEELLPEPLCSKFMSLPEVFKILHHPPVQISIEALNQVRHPAQIRLILEELLAHHLATLTMRKRLKKHRAVPMNLNIQLPNKLLDNLPFSLTDSQKCVIEEIKKDMTRSTPMMRLVQGDVGCGKTLVAAITALIAIANNYQVALMAPTELLAEQHAYNFNRWFDHIGIKIGLLLGKQKGSVRQKQQEAIACGQTSMLIGTHTLFQHDVKFYRLALIIIDEQHRFGVHQRLSFWKKGANNEVFPHQLVMTATPIPRTLAMTVYTGLDISTINEMPLGRIPVTTAILADTKRDEIIQRIKFTCLNQGRQAYWVCTIIEDSELLQAQAAKACLIELQKKLPELRIALIHGQMKNIEKKQIMKEFQIGNIQLLVATTVIEVGVNVTNASLIIIENSERLGLAQLHQLRGRVGRGKTDSYCILLYKAPLSSIARKRLQILRESNNGFFIAKRDMELRGYGEIMGTKQTGNVNFKVVNLLRDEAFISQAQQMANYIQKYYPNKALPIIERWLSQCDLYSNA